jgi:glycerol uptake facilitator protein
MFSGFLEQKEKDMGVKRGERGSVVTAMCYGEFHPNPTGMPKGPWSDAAWDSYSKLVPTSRALLVEVLCTAVLALVVFGVTDPRNTSAPPGYLVPFILGLTVAALISIAAPLTQACLNPARDFGPRLFTLLAGWGTAALPGINGSSWLTVYIAAPIVGAVAGGGIWEFLLGPAWTSVAEGAKKGRKAA